MKLKINKLLICVLLLVQSSLFSQDSACSDQLLTIKLIPANEMTVGMLIETLGRQCGYSMFYNSEETKQALREQQIESVTLENYLADDIIEYFSNNADFHYSLDGNTLSVSLIKTETFKLDFLDNTRSGTSSLGVSVSSSSGKDTGSGDAKINTIETFDFWSTIENEIGNIITRPEDVHKNVDPRIVINKKGSIVTVSGTKKQLKRTRDYIDDLLTTLRRQVVIDVKVLSVELDNGNKQGINWSEFNLNLNGGLGFKSNSVIPSELDNPTDSTGKASTAGVNSRNAYSTITADASFDIEGVFDFMRKYGDTRSLSSPKIRAMNNQPTLISVGDTLNYTNTQTNSNKEGNAASTSTTSKSIFVGVLLDITPQIDENGFIMLRINPSITATKGDIPADRPPDTTVRRISSVVRLQDGETAILGGLIKSNKGVKENKVWLLGDIPFLGWLFKSQDITDKTEEIVFVITPRIINQEDEPTLSDLGFSISEDSFDANIDNPLELKKRN